MLAKLVGHGTRRTALEKLYRAEKLPHSFIFAGTSGIGKRLVAYELYRTFYCTSELNNKIYGGCDTCKNCHLFLSLSLPYLRVIDCLDKDACNVDSLRRMLHELHLKVESDAKRVVILDNADNLSIQAQNILLKTLEEPRPDVFFCLVCSNPNRLLATIQSRCQVWYFDNLTNEQVQSVLELNQVTSPDPELSITALATLADGSLENIQHIIENADYYKIAKEILRGVSKRQYSLAFQKLSELKADKTALRWYLSSLRILGRQAMFKATTQEKVFAWSIFTTNTIIAEQLIFERNLNPEIVLQNLSLTLGRPAYHLSFTAVADSARLLSESTV